jgi:hypothetical protein
VAECIVGEKLLHSYITVSFHKCFRSLLNVFDIYFVFQVFKRIKFRW